MGQRLALHQILKGILGTSYVYFQPPESTIMQYPCIVYSRDNAKSQFADGMSYLHKKRYQVTVIDRDPDSEIPDKLAKLPLCTFLRFYTADNLNHDLFQLYY